MPWAVLVALGLVVGASGCDAIIGLGEEPTEGNDSGSGGAPSSATDASAGEQGSSVGSSQGGSTSTGEGASGPDASSASSSTSSSSGSGGGGGEAPCGACSEPEDCGVDGLCDVESARCKVRTIPLTIDVELDVNNSRGFAVLDDRVAFINPGSQEILVTSMRTGKMGTVEFTAGGVVVADGVEMAVMTFGPGSTLNRIVCGENDEQLTCSFEAIDIGSPDWGTIGADAVNAPGTLFVAARDSRQILRFPTADFGEICEVASFQQEAAHIFFATDDARIAWTNYAGSEGGFEVEEGTCTDQLSISVGDPRITIAYGAAQHDGHVVFNAYGPELGFTAFHATLDGGLDAEPMAPAGGGILPTFASVGITYRPFDDTFLLPDDSSGLWACPVGDAPTCVPFQMPEGGPLSGRVYAVHADEERIIALQTGTIQERFVCIDETMR